MKHMEGPLSKWTNVIEGWQYRWFVLDEEAGILSYYTSKEKMLKGQRRGCVRLKGAIVGIDDEDDSTFTITVDQKMFHFQARDYEERDRWIRALETTIQQHSDFYRLKYKTTHAALPNSLFNLDLFDRRISEADAYLQMMIDGVKKIKAFCETTEPKDQTEAGSDVVVITHALLESFKHLIVLLQLAKGIVECSKAH
ncbi:unnamed protein product [Soboliphyme baturini]|uniref:PH domain-containing protein n=1 Tax=Soboliphyme baturini TaxID=241478 RepID=A0A183IIH3_9BILA|nr:unnamed protein product [Soboliphyme baturini]